MKFVNDKGLSTPERLYAIGEMLKANFRWTYYAYSAPSPGEVAYYPISNLNSEREPVSDYYQVVGGQAVLWCVNQTEDVYLCVIKSVNYTNGTFNLSDAYLLKGTPGKNGTNGTNGKDGKDGLDALESSYSFYTNMAPIVGGYLNISEDNFNREPIVGDIALYTWKNGLTNKSYIVSGKCTVSNPGAAKTFQTVSFIETTGAQGQPGTIDENQINTIKSSILQTIYPVGAYYITEKNENPSVTLGFGTWTQVQGRFLVGQQSGLYQAGTEGGEASHTLSLNEIPAHGHKMNEWTLIVSAGANTGQYNIIPVSEKGFVNIFKDDAEQNRYSVNAGGNQPHNNMPPYRAVFIWRRTA